MMMIIMMMMVMMMALAREDQINASQRVAVHYFLWEQATKFTKPTGIDLDGEQDRGRRACL